MLWCGAAHGDGGTVRLKETSRPFVITVFTAPEPLRAGPADVSVLVQERGEPILDAEVSIALWSEASSVFTAEATHAQATNKLLYAAAIDLPAPGTWMLRVDVRHGSDNAELSTDLSVSPGAPPLHAIWIYLLVPPAAILLFALHQWRAGRATAVS